MNDRTRIEAWGGMDDRPRFESGLRTDYLALPPIMPWAERRTSALLVCRAHRLADKLHLLQLEGRDQQIDCRPDVHALRQANARRPTQQSCDFPWKVPCLSLKSNLPGGDDGGVH